MYCHSATLPSSFGTHFLPLSFISKKNRGEDISSRNQTRLADLGKLHQPVPVSPHDDAVDLSSSSMFCLKSGNVTVVSHNLSYAAALNTSIGSAEIATTGAGCLDTGQYMYQKGTGFDSSLGNGQSNENWGDSGMADNSLQTDTSTDVDTDDKNQLRGVPHGADMVVNSMDQSKGRTSDQKCLLLADPSKAGSEVRIVKLQGGVDLGRNFALEFPYCFGFGKAYVQQLENSRLRLTQLEQELQRARQQGFFLLHLDFVGIMAIQWMEMVRDFGYTKMDSGPYVEHS
ncbi:hypothetical protein POTOM_038117 [Populus tomentosa]|uniref:Uncharacterized protein n=1 Tax=Populus tomentosa TaxID=118781 RepID=A0A8X8CL24_POPTO|nr:hypothetical protein POTOM_038117 [Populus tomentosa]